MERQITCQQSYQSKIKLRFFDSLLILASFLALDCGGPGEGKQEEEADGQKIQEGVANTTAQGSELRTTGIQFSNSYMDFYPDQPCEESKELSRLETLTLPSSVDAVRSEWVTQPVLHRDTLHGFAPSSFYLAGSQMQNQETILGFMEHRNPRQESDQAEIYIEFGTLSKTGTQDSPPLLSAKRLLKINSSRLYEWRFSRWEELASSGRQNQLFAIENSSNTVEWQIDKRLIDTVLQENFWWVRVLSRSAGQEENLGIKFFKGGPHSIPDLGLGLSCKIKLGPRVLTIDLLESSRVNAQDRIFISGKVLASIFDFENFFQEAMRQPIGHTILVSPYGSFEYSYLSLEADLNPSLPRPQIIHQNLTPEQSPYHAQKIYLETLEKLSRIDYRLSASKNESYLSSILGAIAVQAVGPNRLPKDVIQSYLSQKWREMVYGSFDVGLWEQTDLAKGFVESKSAALGAILFSRIDLSSVKKSFGRAFLITDEHSVSEIENWINLWDKEGSLGTRLLPGWFQHGAYDLLYNPLLLKDFDQDGISNLIELKIGTNPSMHDSDQDGWSDLAEWSLGRSPQSVSDKPSQLNADQNFGDWEELLPTSIEVYLDNAIESCPLEARLHVSSAVLEANKIIFAAKNKRTDLNATGLSWEIQVHLPSIKQTIDLGASMGSYSYLVKENSLQKRLKSFPSTAPLGVQGLELVLDGSSLSYNFEKHLRESDISYRVMSFATLNGEKTLCSSGPWLIPLLYQGKGKSQE